MTAESNLDILMSYVPGGVVIPLTETMLKKSAIDARQEIRSFLVRNEVFDFEKLKKGDKSYLTCQLFDSGNLYERKVSLVRPQAKPNRPGDPRIWIYSLNKNADAGEDLYLSFWQGQLLAVPIKNTRSFKDHIDLVFGGKGDGKAKDSTLDFPNQDDENLTYKVSSGLKNLIGKQLITDDFVAVFELVKNSFDAHASNVEISFEKSQETNGKITIKDNGKGMSFKELKNRWLFVGYSAKREGTEDEDYRSKSGVRRHYAGAHGVGRFSCDRLGRKLKLVTRKKDKNSSTEVLYTDWDKFEDNSRARFEDIGVEHEQIPNSKQNFEHGTVLEITELESTWSRNKLLRLKSALEKLILPHDDSTKQSFQIKLLVETEKDGDKGQDYQNRVNGLIKNQIFEKIGLKTTTISVTISEDGNTITTELIDRGERIYRLVEANSYLLHDIKFRLFYLNQAAKTMFTKKMGMPMYRYGHVFVYKNGFRINPYGNYQEDGFGVDIRRSQKDFSRLGTRSLAGRIEIHGHNSEFKETTSRDGGFVENRSFDQLKSCYYDILERFENYVVDVIRWGTKVELQNLDESDRKEALVELIRRLTNAEEITELWYSERLIDILSTKEETTAKGLLKNLQRIAEETGSSELMDDIVQAQQKVAELEAVTEQAEEIAKEAKVSLDEAKEALEFEQEKNKYLESVDRSISDDARGLLHSVLDVTNKINANIHLLTNKIKEGNLGQKFLMQSLGKIKYNVDKAVKISKLITRADFKGRNEKKTIDIAGYLNEYLDEYITMIDAGKMNFEVNRNDASLYRKVSLLDLSIIIDNIITNSYKAESGNIRIDMSNPNKDTLIVEIKDDGVGLAAEYTDNPDKIFDLGETSTDGSGIGLSVARERLKAMNGTIEYTGLGMAKTGAAFELRFN